MAKERASYSREDERHMWMFLYDQLRKGEPAAREPKGLKIWKLYAEENIGRTADSLNTRFRRSMMNRLYDASLPCHMMMYLYSQYQIPMTSDVKIALELRFQIQIILKPSGALKSFKRKEEPLRVQAGRSPLETPPCQEESESQSSKDNSPSPSTERGPESPEFAQQTREVERSSIKKLKSTDSALSTEESDGAEDNEEIRCSANTDFHNEELAHHAKEGPSSGPAQPPSSNDATIEDDIIVLTTSDSYKKSLQRCFAAYGLGNAAADEIGDWRTSDKIVFLTSKWHSNMKDLVTSYDLNADGTQAIIALLSRKQKKLLVESENESEYFRSLLSTKAIVKRDLDELTALFRSSSSSRPIVRVPDETYSFEIRHVYENVNKAARQGALENLVAYISESLHPANIASTLKELEGVEELVAAFSANKVENAVKKRMSTSQ
ncbi:unnamed protein product [Cylicocyclus nassatus]|uniref:SPK domain-containing protein n=1 Tax=Cylicocyclus nassatus TaxID=53992 RepID=A0AA36MHS5_CYLNA|nr:unnamed protein product [Cylicocyclus nassatus]